MKRRVAVSEGTVGGWIDLGILDFEERMAILDKYPRIVSVAEEDELPSHVKRRLIEK